MITKKGFLGYTGRFSLTHVITYTVIALVFLLLQNSLPESQQVALEFFRPYEAPGLLTTSVQLVRGAVLAVVLYPFYDRIVRSDRGWLVLFGALWGLALLCSVEPTPERA